jgi:acyl-coenzyme A thioesterase PaaI-like protein
MSRDMNAHDLKALRAEGWSEIEDDGFIDLVGPFFHRKVEEHHQYAVVAQTKHRNLRGVVQGGMLMTFADRTMGLAAYQALKQGVVTIQMDSQFIDTAKIGELLLSQPRVVRGTRSVVFMSTEVMAGERCVILATAVFKIVRPRA